MIPFRPQTGMERPATGFVRPPATATTNRRFADATYFESELLQKTSNIRTEISKMLRETEVLEGESGEISKAQNMYDTLLNEVRDLEGDLADFNLALDKIRTHTGVEF